MTKKGVVKIIMGILVCSIVLIVGVFTFIKLRENKKENKGQATNPISYPNDTNQPTSGGTVEYNDMEWLTYVDEDYGFKFKYPRTVSTNKTDLDSDSMHNINHISLTNDVFNINISAYQLEERTASGGLMKNSNSIDVDGKKVLFDFSADTQLSKGQQYTLGFISKIYETPIGSYIGEYENRVDFISYSIELSLYPNVDKFTQTDIDLIKSILYTLEF